jgi:hypothetical protein
MESFPPRVRDVGVYFAAPKSPAVPTIIENRGVRGVNQCNKRSLAIWAFISQTPVTVSTHASIPMCGPFSNYSPTVAQLKPNLITQL